MSALALLLFAPLLVLVSLLIWIEDGGSPLFRQTRTGLHGRLFRIYKLRTMRVAEDGELIAQAIRGDARITWVGSVLRYMSLDELPQLLNVVKGDMSFVGPRPHALSHDKLWAASYPDYARRFRVRPGITGRAQVMGLRGEIKDALALRARIEADNAYIDEWSFLGDLRLIARTAPLLLGDARAH